jgi:D-alanine-D-alanine ligase
MSDKKIGSVFSRLFEKVWVRQLFYLSLLMLIFLLLVMWALRLYTRHGQKIELADLKDLTIEEAREITNPHDFELVISDSIFVVGKSGGIILDQNPKPGSFVKEDRKIYITVTKQNADKILVKNLPALYGNAYEQKKKELEYRNIKSTVKSYQYDFGEPNHILEVWYKGQLIISKDLKRDEVEIEKGSLLEFVLSEKEGGEIPIPDLRCMTLAEATFLLESNKLMLGEVIKQGNSNFPTDKWYILDQQPSYDGISVIERGQAVMVTIVPSLPSDCN